MYQFIKNKTALIIVDLQNDFVRAGGSYAVEDAVKTLPNVKSLIAMARKNEMPVIYVKFVAGPIRTFFWNTSEEIGTKQLCNRGHKRFYSDVQCELLCTDIVDEIYPEEGDYIVEKYNNSAFKNTNLIDILKAEGRDSVIITGTVTQICVEDTVRDAFANDLKILVASDGVSSFDHEMHCASLRNFAMKFGDVKTTEEILEIFSD